MRHNYLGTDTSGDHWAVNWTGDTSPEPTPRVLVQLQYRGEQVRAPLDPDHAEAMAAALLAHAAKVRQATKA